MSDSNKENEDRAIDAISRIAKGKAKGILKKKLKKNKKVREVKKAVEESPTLRTVGALSLMLAKKSAAKVEKRFKTGKNSSVRIRGEYNPRTKEKKVGVFYDKEF